MTQYTIDQDIDFLRELASDLGCDDMTVLPNDGERLNAIADRLEEIEAIMPVVFENVPHEYIDRALDMLDVKRMTGLLGDDEAGAIEGQGEVPFDDSNS